MQTRGQHPFPPDFMDICFDGVDLTVSYSYRAGEDASQDSPGCDEELDILGVTVADSCVDISVLLAYGSGSPWDGLHRVVLDHIHREQRAALEEAWAERAYSAGYAYACGYHD